MSFLFFYETILDGFNNKVDKIINYYFINEKIDWGNLYIEGTDIDFKAAIYAERKLHGGHFDEKIHCVIPEDHLKTANNWKIAKTNLLKQIGAIPDSLKEESQSWENTSLTVEQLLEDAENASALFKEIFNKIAAETKTVAHYGEHDKFIIKTKESLERKINQDMNNLKLSRIQALAKIGDALRGTLIVDHIEKINPLLQKINFFINEIGGKVTYKNIWKEDRKYGYAGIHAKIYFPLYSNGQIKYLLAEMQIHLDTLVDGTEMCPKERQHEIYVNNGSIKKSPQELEAASKLLFLIGMEQSLEKNKPTH